MMLDRWANPVEDVPPQNSKYMKLKIFRLDDYPHPEDAVNEFIIDLQKRGIPNQMTTLETVIYVLYECSGGDSN